MCHRVPKSLVLVKAPAVALAALLLSWVPVFAQTPGAQAPTRGTKAGATQTSTRGTPDLQGLWSFATVTPLQRPKEFAGREVLTPEEEAKLEQQAVRDQFVDRPPPPGDPGAYNRFWVDSGTKVVATHCTSLVVDPPDGRVPPLTAHGKEREAARE